MPLNTVDLSDAPGGDIDLDDLFKNPDDPNPTATTPSVTPTQTTSDTNPNEDPYLKTATGTGPLRIPAQTQAPQSQASEQWEPEQPVEGLNPRQETPPSNNNGDKTPPPSGGEPLQFDLDNTPFHDTMDVVNNLINAHPESERWLQPMLEAAIRSNPKTEAQVEGFRAGIKAYHAALDNADPFALKVGMDAARPSMRFGSKPYAFLEDAVMAGNMPLTFNPVRLGLMRMEQMGRFSMAHDIRNHMIEKQIARPFKLNDTKPEGWVPLEDKLFAIKQFVPEQGGIINRGQYYAPEAVAEDFNEFVKSGATGKWVVPYTNLSLYDAARGWAGLANRFQLSLSVLHGMETTLNAAASELGDGIVRGSSGDFVGATKSVIYAASFFGPVIRNIYYGNHAIANMKDPTKALDQAWVTSAAEAAGFRLNLDPLFETHELEKMKVNWGKVTSDLPLSNKIIPAFKLPLNLAGATIEKTTWPLMNWAVPRAKVGAFRAEMKRVYDLNPGESQEFYNREAEKAWDSVDDRFGEFVNSNWFVSQAMKDVLNVFFRSPGWNVGTARQGAGGLVDLAKTLEASGRTLKQLGSDPTVLKHLVDGGEVLTPEQKKAFRISSRTGFMIALPMMLAYVNAIYQKLHAGTFPSSPIDYFFPQTGTKNRDGEPNRVMPKSYVGDVINFYHDPAMSLFHKAAPEISTMSDIMQNSNYYGQEVYDPASSGLSKLGQMALFSVQNSSTPFSLSNYSERKLRSPKSQMFGQAGLESSLGYLPAPAWVGKTDAENLASKYYTMENPQGIKDEEEMDHKQTFVQLRQKALAGKITSDQVTKATQSGKLKPSQIRYLFRAQNQTALEYHTERLNSMDRKMAIYQSATPEEKQKLLPILTRGLATVGPEQQQKDMKILGLQ